MRAVVTAGGTSELIDDVRVLTNLSTGRFGAAIANALVARGIEVTLLAGRALADRADALDPAVSVVPFGGFADLEAALGRACAPAPDLLFMAAAVSDYTPVRAEGKIRSDLDELVLVLRRTPKLLGRLRALCGPDTFLVGFKLLSGVSNAELVRVAHHQVQRDRLDLCVANDLQELVGGQHPVRLVTPEGGARRVDGTKAQVAAEVVGFALRRHAARRPPIERVDRPVEAEPPVMDAARDAGGGGSWRAADGAVAFAGGGRADWTASGALQVTGDVPEAAVHAWWYRAVPALQVIVDLPEVFGAADARTAFAWPTGTLDEAEEIARAVVGAAVVPGEDFAVRRVDRGAWIGSGDGGRFVDQWRSIRTGANAAFGGSFPLAPVLDRARVVGAVATMGDVRGLWIAPEHRRRGIGDQVAQELDRRGLRVRVTEPRWWSDRGWIEGPHGWEPPSMRAGWIEAASACVVAGSAVLLGRRDGGSGPWAFPGGRRQPSDPSLLDAAVRELAEETGVELPWVEVSARHQVHVGGYAITCFVVPALSAVPPRPTRELDARWVPLDQVDALAPMTAGTRRVLRELRR